MNIKRHLLVKLIYFKTRAFYLKLSWLVLFCLVLFSSKAFSQQTIIVIDSENGKVENYAWVELLRNGYQPITKGLEWKPNYLTNLKDGIEIQPGDSLFFALYNPQYLPIWEEIDINSPDTLTVYLRPDSGHPGQNVNVFNGDYNFSNSEEFYPRVITSWENVPEKDQKYILDYLKNYVGEELFEKLNIFKVYSMYSDQITASGRTEKYFPNEFIYNIILSFEYPSLDIEWYSTSMEVSSSGRKYKAPKLPNSEFLKLINQSSLPILSKSQILEKLAEGPRFDLNTTKIEFTFSERADVFIWKSLETRIGTRGLTFITETHFDAVSGIILAKFFDRLDIIYD